MIAINPEKRELFGIETLAVIHDHHRPVAFMCIETSKIGMLFVSPDYFGKGTGRELAEGELCNMMYGM